MEHPIFKCSALLVFKAWKPLLIHETNRALVAHVTPQAHSTLVSIVCSAPLSVDILEGRHMFLLTFAPRRCQRGCLRDRVEVGKLQNLLLGQEHAWSSREWRSIDLSAAEQSRHPGPLSHPRAAGSLHFGLRGPVSFPCIYLCKNTLHRVGVGTSGQAACSSAP